MSADALRADDFDAFFADRRERLCVLIGKAMGKTVQRDVDEGHATEGPDEFESPLGEYGDAIVSGVWDG